MSTLSKLKIALAVAAIAIAPAVTNAQAFSGLFNTGVDGSGNPLAAGTVDSHYQVLGNQAFVINNASPYAFDGNSRYIWENADGTPVNVTRTFRTTFTLNSGYNPLTAILFGAWSTDNYGLDILINGVSTGMTSPGFGSYTSFQVNSGIVSGVNTLDFVVQDVGVISALAVTNLGGRAATTVAPEPSAIALTAAGLLALGVAARRRKRQI